MVFAAFAVARVRDDEAFMHVSRSSRDFFSDVVDENLLGLGSTKREFIAFDADLNGVSHWCALDHCDGCIWDEPHVQKMLAQGPLSADAGDGGGFADGEIVQSKSHQN